MIIFIVLLVIYFIVDIAITILEWKDYTPKYIKSLVLARIVWNTLFIAVIMGYLITLILDMR